jgi:hypothetical protein
MAHEHEEEHARTDDDFAAGLVRNEARQAIYAA